MRYLDPVLGCWDPTRFYGESMVLIRAGEPVPNRVGENHHTLQQPHFILTQVISTGSLKAIQLNLISQHCILEEWIGVPLHNDLTKNENDRE